MPDSFETFLASIRRNWAMFIPMLALGVALVAAAAVARAQIDDQGARLTRLETGSAQQALTLSAIDERTKLILDDVRELRLRPAR